MAREARCARKALMAKLYLMRAMLIPAGPANATLLTGYAHCAHAHGDNRWHGFPIEWRRVPARVRNDWLNSGKVAKCAIQEYW